jgi:two-component system response regulator BaeR
LFLEHLGQVYSRAQLLDHINPDSFDVADRVIDSHIKNFVAKSQKLPKQGIVMMDTSRLWGWLSF